MKRNDWNISFYELFDVRYRELVLNVAELRKKDPGGYRSHKKYKLLASIQKSIKHDVPSDPLNKKFMLSKTLRDHKEWRRVKQGLPARYRMFFRFSTEYKTIIFAWFNDETTLRKAGGKHDVYAIFQKMLENGTIPTKYEDLMAKSKTA